MQETRTGQLGGVTASKPTCEGGNEGGSRNATGGQEERQERWPRGQATEGHAGGKGLKMYRLDQDIGERLRPTGDHELG